MTDRWLAAGFFVPRTDAALEALAACAGVRELRDAPGSGASYSGVWAGLHVQVGRSRLQLAECPRLEQDTENPLQASADRSAGHRRPPVLRSRPYCGA